MFYKWHSQLSARISQTRWRTKIMALAVILLLTNVITAGIFVFMMFLQVRTSETVLEESLLRSNMANKIQIGSAHRSWYQCLLSSSKQPQALRDAAISMVQATASLEQHIKNLYRFSDNYKPDNRVVEMQNVLLELRPTQLQIMQFLKKGKINEANEKSQEALQYAYLMEDIAKDIVDNEQSRIKRKLLEMARTGQHNTYWVIGLTGVVVIFGVSISWYLARLITKPLEALREDLAQVAQGNLHVDFKVPGTGEIGQLTQTLGDTLHALAVAQERLMAQDKLASLGSLTAGVAHEIRNPMNFIKNFSETNLELAHDLGVFIQDLMQKPQVDPVDLQPLLEVIRDLGLALEKIQQHTHRIDKIVHGMLQYSGGVTHEVVTSVVLGDFLEQVVTMVSHTFRTQYPDQDVRLTQDYDPQCPLVPILPSDLNNALSNILSNAFYAVIQKKKKTHTGRYVSHVAIKTAFEGQHVRITIQDNGVGIRPEIMGQVFTPFFTTKPTGEGTGLGLSIAQDIIINRHRGHLKVDSEADTFTEVTIILPVAQRI